MNRHRNLHVLARYLPRVTGDLMPGLSKAIGAETIFTYSRQMDEDEPFPGEWVLQTDDERFGNYWIPERDLEIIGVYPMGHCQGTSG